MNSEKNAQYRKFAGGLILFLLVSIFFTFSIFQSKVIYNQNIVTEGNVVGGRRYLWGIIRSVDFTYITHDQRSRRWSHIYLLFSDNDFKIGDRLELRTSKGGNHPVIEGYLDKQQAADLVVVIFSLSFFIFMLIKLRMSLNKNRKHQGIKHPEEQPPLP